MSVWKRSKAGRRRGKTQEHCAFCDREIPADHEVFGFGAKAQRGVDLENRRGQIIAVTVRPLSKTVPAVVTGAESTAARKGHDLYFMTCSETCAANLRAALEADIGWDDSNV